MSNIFNKHSLDICKPAYHFHQGARRLCAWLRVLPEYEEDLTVWCMIHPNIHITSYGYAWKIPSVSGEYPLVVAQSEYLVRIMKLKVRNHGGSRAPIEWLELNNNLWRKVQLHNNH